MALHVKMGQNRLESVQHDTTARTLQRLKKRQRWPRGRPAGLVSPHDGEGWLSRWGPRTLCCTARRTFSFVRCVCRKAAGDQPAQSIRGVMVRCAWEIDGSLSRPPDSCPLLISSLLSSGKPVVVIPERLAPTSACNGVLITGNCARSQILAAHALIGAIYSGKSV
jgi:hypothetical protein